MALAALLTSRLSLAARSQAPLLNASWPRLNQVCPSLQFCDTQGFSSQKEEADAKKQAAQQASNPDPGEAAEAGMLRVAQRLSHLIKIIVCLATACIACVNTHCVRNEGLSRGRHAAMPVPQASAPTSQTSTLLPCRHSPS